MDFTGLGKQMGEGKRMSVSIFRQQLPFPQPWSNHVLLEVLQHQQKFSLASHNGYV